MRAPSTNSLIWQLRVQTKNCKNPSEEGRAFTLPHSSKYNLKVYSTSNAALELLGYKVKEEEHSIFKVQDDQDIAISAEYASGYPTRLSPNNACSRDMWTWEQHSRIAGQEMAAIFPEDVTSTGCNECQWWQCNHRFKSAASKGRTCPGKQGSNCCQGAQGKGYFEDSHDIPLRIEISECAKMEQ